MRLHRVEGSKSYNYFVLFVGTTVLFLPVYLTFQFTLVNSLLISHNFWATAGF